MSRDVDMGVPKRARPGVGAATHSTLQLALGVAALLAGLGLVCTVMGIAFIMHTRSALNMAVAGGVSESAVDDAAGTVATHV